MEQRVVFERYPVFVLEVPRCETDYASLEALAAYFIARIEAHPYARFIAEFDHFAHTRALPEGEINPAILDARNVVFCFGICIPDAESLALRPRSIGLAALEDRFVISFLETPMPLANSAMEQWARRVCNRPSQQPDDKP